MAISAGKTTNKKRPIDLHLVRQWLKEAGKIALIQRDFLDATLKTDGTLVTNIDRQIETLLVERISRYYPDHQILAEEGSNKKTKGEFLWAIDPIDGTRAYVSGLPIWGISVGILRRGDPYAGVFFMPATGEAYWGTDDKAFLNDRPLLFRKNADIRDTSAFIAVPSNAHCYYTISFPRLRSLGSTTAHLAYVACGFAMAALTRRIYIWDVAAVLPWLEITGVRLVYLSGKTFNPHELLDGHLSPEPLVAAPFNIIEDVRKLIRIQEKPDTQERK